MIKKAPITEMYQINMYCDKCETRMEKSDGYELTNPITYEYYCPNCGHKSSSHVSYPVTQYHFDETNAVVIEEPNIKPIEINIPDFSEFMNLRGDKDSV